LGFLTFKLKGIDGCIHGNHRIHPFGTGIDGAAVGVDMQGGEGQAQAHPPRQILIIGRAAEYNRQPNKQYHQKRGNNLAQGPPSPEILVGTCLSGV
jgi:hypothetical protein